MEPTAIFALRDDLLAHDAIDEAVSICRRELGIEAKREGSLIRLLGRQSGDLRWKLLRVIGLAEKVAFVGAWAESSDGSEMLAVWKRPDLVVAHTTLNGMSGKWYVLDSFQSPRVLATGQELSGEHAWWPQQETPPAEVRALFEQAGLAHLIARRPPACEFLLPTQAMVVGVTTAAQALRRRHRVGGSALCSGMSGRTGHRVRCQSRCYVVRLLLAPPAAMVRLTS